MATNNTRKSTARKSPARKSAPRSAHSSGANSIGLGALSAGALAVGAIAAGVFGLLKLGGGRYVAGRPLFGGARDGGHEPTDLMGDEHPGPEDRAIEAFRPDPTAPIPANERDAFRPALAGAAAPTLVKGQARENERLDAAPS